MTQTDYGEVSWDRMVGAVEKVRQRLLRAVAALERAGISYAVAGGNAVAAWVSSVDEEAVRNTRDVDVLLLRGDLTAARAAMEEAGFIYRQVKGVDMFLDGPDAKARGAVHVVFAGEKVRPEYVAAAPDVSESSFTAGMRLLHLESLVRMKLTSFRDKDRVHLRDLIEVGLIDESWSGRFAGELGMRLTHLLENPED